jgi:hypothetical protein
VLGPEHLETLASQAARAGILYMGGELELARQAQEQVLAVRARLLGAEHPDSVQVGEALGLTLARMEQLERQEQQDRQNLHEMHELHELHELQELKGLQGLQGQQGPQERKGHPDRLERREDGSGPGLRVPGVEQEVAAYFDAPCSLQRAEPPLPPLPHEQLHPDPLPDTRVELR